MAGKSSAGPDTSGTLEKSRSPNSLLPQVRCRRHRYYSQYLRAHKHCARGCRGVGACYQPIGDVQYAAAAASVCRADCKIIHSRADRERQRGAEAVHGHAVVTQPRGVVEQAERGTGTLAVKTPRELLVYADVIL